ncbi:ribonuclease H1-like [Leptopilina heterotoma]|uniref:ribonuclease H1-like n=1 Tax=Leptopilina heterotoma TaxID=63436 RepID=UPI001CA7FDB5|nr:ribonuclease H1-like [Leptopilina heterotoma]
METYESYLRELVTRLIEIRRMVAKNLIQSKEKIRKKLSNKTKPLDVKIEDLVDVNEENDKKGLRIDKDGYVHVYTDGACKANGKPNAQAEIGIWFNQEHPLNISDKACNRQTNNSAEMEAIIKAIEILKNLNYKKIRIHTDSKFVIYGIKEWLPKWENNGWKTSRKREVISKKDFVKMKSSLNNLEVELIYEPGHTGIIGNKGADRLAKLAIEN